MWSAVLSVRFTDAVFWLLLLLLLLRYSRQIYKQAVMLNKHRTVYLHLYGPTVTINATLSNEFPTFHSQVLNCAAIFEILGTL